jgi:hypothetical protein
VKNILKWLGIDKDSRLRTQDLLAEADERAEKTSAVTTAKEKVRKGELPSWSVNHAVDDLLGVDRKYDRRGSAR